MTDITDDRLREILSSNPTIAVVGASPKPTRVSRAMIAASRPTASPSASITTHFFSTPAGFGLNGFVVVPAY
jgi:hypothetical protein